MDPWYDFLALPAAPLVLVGQAAALGIRNRGVRRLVMATGAALIAVMLLIVIVLAPAGSGANIGAGILVIELIVALVLAGSAWSRQDAPPSSG